MFDINFRLLFVFLIWNYSNILMMIEFIIILKPKYNNYITIFLFEFLTMIPMAFRMTDVFNMTIRNIILFPSMILMFIYTVIMFKDNIHKKILAFSVKMFSDFGADFCTSAILTHIFKDAFTDNKITDKLIYSMLIGIVICTICSILTVIFWKLFIDKSDVKRYIVFLIFPISQILIIIFITSLTKIYTQISNVGLTIGIFLGIIADMILFYNIFTQAKKEELDKQLQEYKYMTQLENNHFKDIQMHCEQLSRMRHDYNGHLQTILLLIESDNKKEALEMIDSLKVEIGKTKTGIYCTNVVINAILSEKEYECKSLSIDLKCDIELGDDLLIDKVHLCSVFSNLMDNAINACKELPDNHRYIKVGAMKKGDYFTIKVINPSNAEYVSRKKREGHGYGTRILAEIAEKYNGRYNATFQDGEYIVAISLLNISLKT